MCVLFQFIINYACFTFAILPIILMFEFFFCNVCFLLFSMFCIVDTGQINLLLSISVHLLKLFYVLAVFRPQLT